MTHTGAYNDVFILVLVSLFFAPFILVNFARLFTRKRQHVYIEQQQPATLDDFFIVHESELSQQLQPVQHQPVLNREQQWNMVVESAMTKAMQGDKGARDWVTKHVFSETEPQQSGIATTSREIIREAHEALKPLGYKPTELKDKIRDLCKDKIYTSADDLIQDFIRGV
tara:strand:+ start:1231 stop:1737 length:507 start_codon:yes stop_codon:yes gene_type:complete